MPQAYSDSGRQMETPAQTTELAAELHNVSVIYGARAAAVHAVKAVSLQVHRGEVLLLMGPSGSGKSTLLQVLGCIRAATAGTILIDKMPIHGLTENELSRLRCERIGFVFQHYNLLPSLRAWENVALALELRGMAGAPIEKASRDMLEHLGLEHRVDAYPEELSGGEKQRVAIARAVVGGPDIILADEPTAALDAASGSQVAQLLKNVAHENGCAVVVVTHDARITGIADRLAYLDDGAILWVRKNVQLQDKSLRESGIHETKDGSFGSLDGSFIRRAAVTG
jgi:putative ABC transport system ATP-binding protein